MCEESLEEFLPPWNTVLRIFGRVFTSFVYCEGSLEEFLPPLSTACVEDLWKSFCLLCILFDGSLEEFLPPKYTV